MAEGPYYDLMVLLDPNSPEQQRSQVIDQVRTQVSGGDGTLKGDADWGLRRLAYEIDHRPDAYYHLFQFQAQPGLLEQLDRNLSIEDSVLRHRIIRLASEPSEVVPRPEPTSAPVGESTESVETPAEGEDEAAVPPAAEAAPALAEPAGEVPSETPAPPDEAPAEPAPAEPAAAGEQTAAAAEPTPESPTSEQ